MLEPAARPAPRNCCRLALLSFLGVALAGACTEDPLEVFEAPGRPPPARDTDSADPSDDVPEAGGDPINDASLTDASEPTDSDQDGAVSPTDRDPMDAGSGGDGTDLSGESTDGEMGPDDPGDGTDEQDTDGETEGLESVPLPDADELDARCGGAPVSSEPFTRRGLRQAAAECAVWHYCRFGAVAEVLDARVQEHTDVATEASLQSAQQAWRAAMDSWSRVELFQFGPLGSRADSAGKDMYEGQGIRDLIYSWPSTSHCRVDEQIVSQNYATRGMDSALISGRGLFGLEVLLFYPELDTACTSATANDWADLSADEIESRRRDYAAAISSDVVARTEELLELWSPAGGDFTTTFVEAQGSYPDEQEVLKVIAWSLVYMEREVKDWKVGIPAGYTLSHPVTVAESPHAHVGIENIRANLAGFQSLFQGCGADGEGIGFDDWLTDAGHGELAKDMLAALAEARRVAAASPSLHEATPQELETLYQALRGLTSLLKAEFFGAGSPLNLELPGGVEGDTD